MANKAPKKKESKEQVNQSQAPREANATASSLLDSAKRKPPIPLWVEWSDQDIANEKWDNGKQAKDRGRSPTSTSSCYEDVEGKIDLPTPLRTKVHSWKRPCEVFNDKVPTVVSPDHVNETHIDLLSPNEHITDSELIRHILSTFTSLYEIFASPNEPETVSSIIKMKASLSKDGKDAKVEKGKKDDYVEEMGWRPWYQIWPKEGAKGNNMPCYNPQGKYAVKLFWMGNYRKIIVDDTIPCDENMKPLLPLTPRGNEIWVIILAKALIKVASLDYYGGLSSSEFGDSNIIHCLTGWLPESIPVDRQNSEKIWNLLLQLLPHWSLPLPHAPKCDDTCLEVKKPDVPEVEACSKQDLVPKESKDKSKKDDKPKDEKKVKANEKLDKEKGKEKPTTPAVSGVCKKLEPPTPDYILFATFLNPPSSDPPCKFSEYKRMANISEKLRQFNLCQYLTHPVHLNTIRICPLLPPPEPLKIPRWKLIRQKKNREIVEPKLRPEQPIEKEPKFLLIKSMFFNFKVNTGDHSSPTSKISLTKIPSISEEGQDEEDECPIKPDNDISPPDILLPEVQEMTVSNVEGDAPKKINRSPSVTSSQSSLAKKAGKSKQDGRKSAQKDRGNAEKKDSTRISIDATQSLPEEQEISDIQSEINVGDMPDIPELEPEKEKEDEKNVIWMDFDDFLQCFSMLWVYHKPKKHMKSIADIKYFENQRSDKPRKSAGTNASDLKNIPSPPSLFGGIASDSLPPFLLVDCVQESEIVIHFSSFSRWFDPNIDLSIKKDGIDQEALLREVLTPVPGTLMVEPYFWKQIVTPSPLLRLSSTGVRCAVLTVPPGRHVLRFMINTPLGYHICITSSQGFIFDNEHVIIEHLTKDSARFISHAVDVLKQLKTISQSFSDKSITRSVGLAIGTEDKPSDIRKEHFETLHSSLAAVLKSELKDEFQKIMHFALNALKFESYFHLPKILPEKRSVEKLLSTSDVTRSASEGSTNDNNEETTLTESVGLKDNEIAASKVQSTFKGFYTRLLMRAYQLPDSKENKMVTEAFEKIWTYIDANIDGFASKLYAKLFEENPTLYPLFPFFDDESNKVSYKDYSGSYPEPANTSWFLMFREIFYVLEPNLIFPKLYCNLQNYQLKIIDNDTKEELKTLFSKVVPQKLIKNKLGYTFVATAWHHSYVSSGKFLLRIIGGSDSLPISASAKEDSVTSNFVTKEIKDYYIPNRYCRIFRHTVKVTEDVLSSIQFLASKDDVLIKLQILDNEEVIYTCEGKRTVTIPAIIFKKDRFPPSDETKNSRASSQAGSITSISKSTNPKQSARRNSSPEKNKKKLLQLAEIKMEEDILEEDVHTYVIECFVKRDTWPLTRKEWIFVENHKNSETIDKEVSSDSVTKSEPASRGSAGKSRKNNRQESRGKKDRPPSQIQNTFDTSKAHWTLRFIIDANMENAIEIKRDTRREEEIKALKAAWEIVEPGRAAKAILSRQKYLESHTVVETVEETEESNADEEGGEEKIEDETLSLPASDPVFTAASDSPIPSEPDTGELFNEPPMKENLPVLMTFDVTPYLRSNGEKIILDEVEEEKRQRILQSKFSNFHEMRERVLQMREDSRISRNLEKEKQLQEYEKMQIQLDEARAELYKARDAYRSKFIPQPPPETESDAEKKKKSPSPKAKASKSRAKKK